jgi:hypothetical protein
MKSVKSDAEPATLYVKKEKTSNVNKRQCGICGAFGHYKKTCTPDKAVSSKKAKYS